MSIFILLLFLVGHQMSVRCQPHPVGSVAYYGPTEKVVTNNPEGSSSSPQYYGQGFQAAASSAHGHHSGHSGHGHQSGHSGHAGHSGHSGHGHSGHGAHHHHYPYGHSGWSHADYGYTGGGHSYPGSYGYDSGFYGTSGTSQSAVGLLGFVALLTLIQNALGHIWNTSNPMMNGRRKRNLEDLSSDAPLTTLTTLVLPLGEKYAVGQGWHLNKVDCALKEICQANRNIMDRKLGRLFGQLVSSCAAVTDTDINLQKKITMARDAGKSGFDCTKMFSRCRSLPP